MNKGTCCNCSNVAEVGLGTAEFTRGPYRNGVRRREQILDVAFAAFAQRGYAGASLRGIAEGVGVTHSALVRHFSSKEELLIAVLEKWELALAANATSPLTGLGYFRALLDDVRYHVDNPGFVQLLLTTCTEGANPQHPAHQWVASRYRRLVVEGVACLAAARSAGMVRQFSDREIDTEVRRLYGAMDGLELQWMSDPTMDILAVFKGTLDATFEYWQVATPRSADFHQT